MKPRCTVDMVGDQQHAVRHGERSEVKGLVVQDAERQPVALGIWSTGLMPADVCRVQGDRYRAEPHVEPADGASVFIRLEHPPPERRVAFVARDGALERQADRVQDVGVQGPGEMLFENSTRDGGGKARISCEGGLHVGRESRSDVVRAQGGHAGDIVAGLERQPSRCVDRPDAVALQPPEWLLRMIRLPVDTVVGPVLDQLPLEFVSFVSSAQPPPEILAFHPFPVR
jgi:hypothetical protein